MISQIEVTTETTWTTWPTPYMGYLPLISSCFVLHSAVSTALIAAVLLTSKTPYLLNPRHVKA